MLSGELPIIIWHSKVFTFDLAELIQEPHDQFDASSLLEKKIENFEFICHQNYL